MESKQHITTFIKNSVATIALNRPQVHNAMDIQTIREISRSIKELESEQKIRMLILEGSGPNFSAGADLDWMKKGMKQDRDQLKSESRELADLFSTIADSRLIVISGLHGKVMGGANGLVAASDIVVAEETTTFAFSEVKLGLVPATIAPFVLRKLGKSRTAELMLTGRTFTAQEAMTFGLVHYTCREGTLRNTMDEIVKELCANGPEALMAVKNLLHWLESEPPVEQLGEHTAGVIARHRISPEGQEGMKAFFEKRRPGWHEAD